MAERRFQSVDHPGSVPWPAIYARALVTPLATCMLPVMILTLVAVLEGVRVVPLAFWGAGAAVAAAAIWTSYRLRSRPVEIRVADAWARVHTAWDLRRGRDEASGVVFDVRDYGTWAHVTVGLASFELEKERWPEFGALVSALQEARREAGEGGIDV